VLTRDQNSGEVALDLTRSDQAVRTRVLPGKSNVSDQSAREPQLPTGGGHQPRPAVSGLLMARADGGPAEGLLDKPERVFDGEAAQIPAPEGAQVKRQWTADPGQPQRSRWQAFVGQPLHLDTDDAERSSRRASDVEFGPGVDLDGAIERVFELGGVLGLAMGGRIGQAKWVAMQSRPTAARLLLGWAVDHAVFGQAYQQVSFDVRRRQRFEVVATIQRDHRARRTRRLSLADIGDLVKCDLRRRLSRWSATLHVQRQDPTARNVRHGHQPLIRPGGHNPVLWPAWQRPILPGAVSAGTRGWPWPVGSVDHPQRTAVDRDGVGQCLGKQLPECNHIDRAIRVPVLTILWLGELAAPISQLLRAGQPPTLIALALVGAAIFVATYLWVVRDAVRVRAGAHPASNGVRLWTPMVILFILAVLLSLGYGLGWLGLFIFTSVGSALRLPSSHAARAIICLTLVAGGIGLAEGEALPDLAQGGLLVAGIGAIVATVDYSIRATRELRAARVELAQLAVSQERLRFARDLHDLLGHSLTLVALKCDLADQLVAHFPDQARCEIQEAASVARQALRDVRAAVAGYRRPTLAQELAGAQEMLAAAGIACYVEAARLELPPEREAALAWALREGVTNVIRHSRAQRCAVRVHHADDRASLEVVDDGKGPSSLRTSSGGSGLAGLAERLSAVGGSVQTSAAPEGGFCLAASVPLADTGMGEVVAAQPLLDGHP